MKYTPREIREEVNVTPRHPLMNFAYLLGTVVSATVAIYIVLGWAVDWVVPYVSPELEAQLGKAVAQNGAALLGGRELVQDPRREYLQGLIEQVPGREAASVSPTVHLVESSLANAAALPGGHIFVTTGLLAAVESENELTFVLAHELGHHVHRDSLRQLGRGLVLAWGMQLAFGSGGTSNSTSVVTTSFNLQNLHYSRRAESAADRFALAAVCQRYGHAHGSARFFERLAADELGAAQDLVAYFQTHPASQARADRLRVEAAARQCPFQGQLAPLPGAIAP